MKNDLGIIPPDKEDKEPFDFFCIMGWIVAVIFLIILLGVMKVDTGKESVWLKDKSVFIYTNSGTIVVWQDNEEQVLVDVPSGIEVRKRRRGI